jgi:hypothetical protein
VDGDDAGMTQLCGCAGLAMKTSQVSL